jgi:hypothetical protein
MPEACPALPPFPPDPAEFDLPQLGNPAATAASSVIESVFEKTEPSVSQFSWFHSVQNRP